MGAVLRRPLRRQPPGSGDLRTQRRAQPRRVCAADEGRRAGVVHGGAHAPLRRGGGAPGPAGGGTLAGRRRPPPRRGRAAHRRLLHRVRHPWHRRPRRRRSGDARRHRPAARGAHGVLCRHPCPGGRHRRRRGQRQDRRGAVRRGGQRPPPASHRRSPTGRGPRPVRRRRRRRRRRPRPAGPGGGRRGRPHRRGGRRPHDRGT